MWLTKELRCFFRRGWIREPRTKKRFTGSFFTASPPCCSNPPIPSTNKKAPSIDDAFLLVGEDGFEPSKSVTTDLQSAPFGRSGTLPGAGDGTRTRNLLITNQLLCQLSYTSLYLVSHDP